MIEHIVVTGGGTGGHLSVAKALTEELHKVGKDAIFIGSKQGLDKQYFEHDIHLRKAIFLNTSGVVNKKFTGKITSFFNMFDKSFEIGELFDEYNVKKIISVGGYSAAPAVMAAIFNRKKLYIHEQNSIMGSLNKYSSKFARYVFNSFDINCSVNNYPVNDAFFENARIRHKIETIIFLGGSQGAKFINDFALKIAPALNKLGIKIIHQSGKNDYERLVSAYEKLDIDVDIFAFTNNLASKMKNADFAVSRAGASTLWELCANALPTLFIPYPYAAHDHQYYNAKFLTDKKIAYLKREKDLTPEYFLKIIKNNPFDMSKALVNSIMLDGAKMIIDTILKDK
jgi:UDP-N-acetylglucosamine--N-acetylmuramyl-(pentapeptide) pyrophosphoryl-undecaprenol N-acetylglucosamine transferase